MGKTLGYGEITVANMTEPFTVMLTNEAQQFATDSNRKVTSAQSYYTDIIVIRGSQERTDYTIGNITSGSGITVSKTSKRVTFSVSAGSVIGADTGIIEIPITLDGQTVKKQFSWSCGKQGPQGVKGTDGNSFAWNMLSETNCGKKHWGTVSSGGKYSVESETTEDNIEAVKLICTESVSSPGWSYTCFTDLEMLKQLKPSTKYTLSYDIKANRSGMISHTICRGDISNSCTNTVVVSNIIGDETWQHISVVLTTNDLKTTPTNEVVYLGRTALRNVGYSIIKNLKLTEGYIDTPWSPSQSDIEGKGIAQIVQYYLATSQASGVTSSTSGWSTDITTQKLTADKKYLWNCSQTKYTDGTSEPITTPTIIGAYGDKGANALQCKRNWTGTYTTINGTALATLSDFNRTPVAGDVFTTLDGSSNTGTWQVISVNGSNVNIKLLSYVNSRGEKGDNAKNLSITPSSQYFKSTDGGKTFAPNQITITPTIQGEINFGKWQYSIDGGVSFADAVSGQKGLTISNNVLAVNKDSSLYSDAVTMVTFRAVASDRSFYDTCSIAKLYDVTDIEIGGVNLIKNSNFADGVNQWAPIGITYAVETDSTYGHHIKFSSSVVGDSNHRLLADADSNFNHSKNTTYTLSFYAKASANTQVQSNIAGGANPCNYSLTTSWQRYTTTYKASAAGSLTFWAVEANKDIYLANIKLERGNKPTDYTVSPEDVQTAILSTKSEISDVSLKVDNNKQAIEQRVEKTTYQQDLKLVKGDISKANEGLNKWRYEIYPKSLFASEYQSKYTMDVFAKNKNLTPSQSVLLDDASLSTGMDYGDSYIAYGLTFIKMSAAKSVTTTLHNDDGASFYVNGKQIISNRGSYTAGVSITFNLTKGWNCLEIVLNEIDGKEGFKFAQTLSKLSECQLMNCYYGTPVARQSHITNQLVQNTTDIKGVSTKVSKVTSVIGDNGENFTSFKNEYSDFKQTMNGFKTTVSQTYVTKDDFNGLEIGGRNLVLDSKPQKQGSSYAVVSRHLSVDLQAGVTYTISFCGRVVDGDGSLVVYLYRNDWKDSIQKSTKSKENTVISWQFTPKISGAFQIEAYSFLSQGVAGGNVYLDWFKVEKGNKPTDWTPAPEDNEINGQNLVSNLPSNWEQGSINYTANLAYGSLKATLVSRLRTKDVFPVSGNIAISAGTSTNSSKEELNFYYVLFDINKKSISHGDTWQSLTSPKIINCGDAKYMAIILRWGSGSSAITPSDISQICLKIERGTSATPFTLTPEDVNGKIVNVETIANQTAKKFEWIVKGGDKSSSMVLTDDFLNIVANKINLKGKVTFESLSSDAKNEIGKVAQSKVDGLEVGGRNLVRLGGLSGNGATSFSYDKTTDTYTIVSPVVSTVLGIGAVVKYDDNHKVLIPYGRTYTLSFEVKVPQALSINIDINNYAASGSSWAGNDNDTGSMRGRSSYNIPANTWTKVWVRWANTNTKNTNKVDLYDNSSIGLVTKDCTSAVTWQIRHVKGELGNKATDWTPAPEDVSQDATNKANQALTDAKNYSSNAVNWVTNNGASTTSLNSMVKKWTDGAVSDTTQINGGWIKTNTITANKIAIGDFTNYADINESNTYWFRAEQTKEGTWFYRDGSELQRDNVISELHTCRGGEKFYVEYDISNTIKEGDEYKYAGLMIFGYDGNGGIVSYNRNAGVTATANGEITHITTQLTMPDTTRSFRVYLQIEGHVPFTGTLKIRNISVRKAVTGNLIVDGAITADKIATDAIKSRNYISSGGTQGSFLNLSDGSFKSPNLSWDSNGNLIAKNANISGEITATDGSIGKFKITDQWLITGSGSTCAGLGGSGQAFWAGAENSTVAPFRVDYDGKLVSSNADISGKITATEGTIGKYEITDTYLKTGSGSTCSGIGSDDCAFWAGGTNSKDSNFVVLYGGSVLVNNLECSDRNSNDALAITNGALYIQSDNNSAFLSSTGFEFEWGGDYRILSVGDGVKCYRNLYATDFIADGWIYNAPGGHYTWKDRADAYISCGNYNNTNNVYYYAGYHAFYVNGDSGSGMMYIETSGVSSRKGFRNSSDERIKQNFSHFDDNFIDTYMNLEPVQYQFKNDTNDKYHFGFKAQQTERILNAYGQESDKSYGICATHAINPEKAEKLYGVKDMHEEYTLAYDELIAPTTYMVQHIYKELELTKSELAKVKQEKADLETRLQAIEAKLGL